MSTKTPTPPTTAAVAPAAPVAPVAAARAPSSRKAAAKKPAAMPAGPVNARASAKSTPKAAAIPAAKPLAKAFAQPDKPAKAEAAPKAAKPTKADTKPAKPAKPAKVRKPKLVRDRFTVTADDYAARRHSPAHRAERYRLQGRARSVAAAQADCRKEGRQELKRLGPATPSRRAPLALPRCIKAVRASGLSRRRSAARLRVRDCAPTRRPPCVPGTPDSANPASVTGSAPR